LDWITLGTAVIISLLLNKFLPGYLSEKGKNLATKEDISQITEKIESVKSIYSNEDKVLERRRQIYEEIVSALRIFISGHGISTEQKEKFYEAYASAWLWAPDSVLIKLNTFVEQQIKYTEKTEITNQETMKKQYGDIVLEMRKDVGFVETEITSKNYVFATFDN
jgi:hypothetical protein